MPNDMVSVEPQSAGAINAAVMLLKPDWKKVWQEDGGRAHDGVADGDGTAQRDFSGQATGLAGADYHAAHGGPEQPEKTGFRHAQMFHQENRGREHVQEEAGKIQ